MLHKNINNFKIKTPNGWESFAGVALMGTKPVKTLTFDDGTQITGTDNHVFFTADNVEIFIKDINIGTILSGTPYKTVVDIKESGTEKVYDIIETESHTFYANDILSHNCRFLSSDPLLFRSSFLLDYNPGPQPEPDSRGIVWFEPIIPKKTYILAIDPSTGTGSDYSVIIIYSFPELTQVAEFRSNSTSTPAVYNTLKYMFKFLQHKGVEICYWSLENNGIGEGMISMYESDPDPIEFGDLVSDDGKKRLGFTTGKNKNKNCLGLKQLFEHGKLVVRSKITVSEMKNFVKSKGSYAARAGSTDDTIAAHLILIQILNNIIAYEDDAYAVMYENFDSDEMNEFDDDGFVPLPIVSGNSPAYGGEYNHDNYMEYFWDNWNVPS